MDAALLSCRDLEAGLVRYIEDGAERPLMVCFAFLPYDSEDSPPSKEFEKLRNFKNENLYLVMWCDSNAHHTAWGNTNCNDKGEVLVEFLNSSNLEFLIRAMSPPFTVVMSKR